MNVVGFIAILLFSALVFSGGVVSNPADSTGKPQAWFLGTGLINTCIVSANDYPLSKKSLMELTSTAIARWKFFVESKQLIKSWPKGKPFLNFDFKISATCKGNEDVKFYFGEADNAVKAVQKIFTNPSALSHLESYDQNSGRGKGFIWVAAPTQEASYFVGPAGEIRSLLMHEIGHMLGCGHVSGTIMREDLPVFMANASPLSMNMTELQYFPIAIEHTRELFFNFQRGLRALIPYSDNQPIEQKKLVERLLKKEINGHVMLGFKQGTESDQHRAQLFVREADNDGKKLSGGVFDIELFKGTLQDFTVSDSSVFRSVLKNQVHEFKVPGFVIDGKLTVDKKTGESVPITFTRNRGDSEFVRLLYAPGLADKVEFFRAYLYHQHEGY